MKAKCYFSKDGKLLNIGEWDRQVRPASVEPAEIVPAITRPEIKIGGKVVHPAVNIPAKVLRPERVIPELVRNEIPEGVVIEEREVIETDRGVFLVEDYVNLRRSEYPTIGDQLDALWAGGDEVEVMRARIEAVKNKYPKP